MDIIFSSLGVLLMVGLGLAVSSYARRAAQSQERARKHTRNPYAAQREHISREAAKSGQREIWANDGSYCPHCGLPRRGEEEQCRRCGGELPPWAAETDSQD